MDWDLHELDRSSSAHEHTSTRTDAPTPITIVTSSGSTAVKARAQELVRPGLGSAIERWLAPQERFDALRSEATRRGGSDFADLAYANPQDGPAASVVDAMRAVLSEGGTLDLQYTPYGGGAVPKRQVARALASSMGLPFRGSHVVLTPGAMGALTIVMRWLSASCGGRRGRVLIPTPCWLDHPLYVEEARLEPVLVPLDPRTMRLDLRAIERALTRDTVAVVLTSPGNPTGVLHREEDLRALGALLEDRPEPPLLVSDEAHRDYVFEGTFVSPAQHYARTVVVYSFGKVALLQGQRAGYVAVSPRMEGAESLAHDLVRLCRVTSLYAPTALMQRVMGRLVEIRPDLAPFRRRRARALEALAAMGWEIAAPDATFFLYPRAPGGDAEGAARRLAQRGVLVLPAEVFHHTGHVRLSLTCTDAALDRALGVMREIAS